MVDGVDAVVVGLPGVVRLSALADGSELGTYLLKMVALSGVGLNLAGFRGVNAQQTPQEN